MTLLECVALAIVALFVAVRGYLGPDRRRFFAQLGLLALASWLAEDSCIHAYGFYAYSSVWRVYIDRVPLLVVLIWPVVIHSAWELAEHLLGGAHQLLPIAGAAIVLADASLIEPIAVRSGLWSWTEPGLFTVAPIGILGWAFFAGVAIAVLQSKHRTNHSAVRSVLVLIVAPLATHALLLVSWWGLFRWINQPLPSWPAAALVWSLSLALTGWSWLRGARLRVPLREMLLRVPAAVFFFVLLALHGREQPSLVCYALAFAPPYLSLLSLSHHRRA